KTAKRVSVETEVFKRRVSVPSVAVVDFALNIFERLTDKKTLALGAGEMAEETLKYLADYGARSVVVSNRSRDKAEKLAAVWNATVVDWDARFDALADADLVIAATGAQEPVVKLDDYRQIEARRRGRPLFILDLSLPRNVEPSVGDRPNVYLYSIDDLEAACVRNREIRDRELPKALRLVDEEAARFMTEIESRRSIDAIRKLRDGWNEIKEAEVERLFRKIGADPETEGEIRYAFDRLVNKLLHSPTTTLRADAQSPSAPALLDAARRLFRL
ncbi:MAG: glutamyl-tRNA reductase, partial [Thermoguttaceae bacterium]|nr:glutamyl-tRNA reductase [Thermoguttaceae bacterium]